MEDKKTQNPELNEENMEEVAGGHPMFCFTTVTCPNCGTSVTISREIPVGYCPNCGATVKK